MVHQLGHFTANKKAVDKITANPKVSVRFNSEPRSFVKSGEKIITEIENIQTGERSILISDGVFVFIGMKPNVDLFDGKLKMDKWGYIVTDEDMQTNVPGVYAVGDVTSKKYRQITTAVADGTIAAMAITRELS
jgi:thioredoxin reductase (NADPH)